MNDNKYKSPYLEPYKGRTSRHECPNCNDKHSFTYYIDGNSGLPIHETVGRCDHESSCGYHYPPKKYFTDHPDLKSKVRHSGYKHTKDELRPTTTVGYIPKRIMLDSIGVDSNLMNFIYGVFNRRSTGSNITQRLVREYHLGCTVSKEIIYWQIDYNGLIRTGKIMQYDEVTGKRIKDKTGSINWVHSKLKKDNVLPGDFHLEQCLFGEHLLRKYPDKVVALVESEKSAIIGSAIYPDYNWLATGGKSQLSDVKLKPLKGRTIIMFPDVDAYGLWCEKAQKLDNLGYFIIVSDLLERNATPEDRKNKIDIADWLIRGISE